MIQAEDHAAHFVGWQEKKNINYTLVHDKGVCEIEIIHAVEKQKRDDDSF